MSIKVNDTVTMLFHGFGLVSDEESKVIVVHEDATITLENEYRFDTKTGKCLNDDTTFGCHRSLKVK